MALKTGSLNSYTNATWTDLVVGSAAGETLGAVMVSNPTASTITMQMRKASSSGSSVFDFAPIDIAPGTYKLDLAPLNLVGSQKLQVSVSAAGLQFDVSWMDTV